jgi:hypothetical protein
MMDGFIKEGILEMINGCLAGSLGYGACRLRHKRDICNRLQFLIIGFLRFSSLSTI